MVQIFLAEATAWLAQQKIGFREVFLGCSVVVALLQFHLASKEAARSNQRKREEYALTYSLTRNDRHVEARQALAKYFGATTPDSEPVPMNVVLELYESEDPKIISYVNLILNHWENMALAICRGVADEDTAFEMVGRRFLNTVRQYRSYIEHVSKESPSSFKYLNWLEKRWQRRKSATRR